MLNGGFKWNFTNYQKKRLFLHQSDVTDRHSLFLQEENPVTYQQVCECPSALKRISLNNWCLLHLHHAYCKSGSSPKFVFCLQVSFNYLLLQGSLNTAKWLVVVCLLFIIINNRVCLRGFGIKMIHAFYTVLCLQM